MLGEQQARNQQLKDGGENLAARVAEDVPADVLCEVTHLEPGRRTPGLRREAPLGRVILASGRAYTRSDAGFVASGLTLINNA
jgi:hypothetical protein